MADGDVDRRLASWRRAAGLATPAVAVERDYMAAQHRELLQRTEELTLTNLRAHDQFCQAIEAYVMQGASERSAEHQQRVTDYAGYLLRMYENTSARALEKELFKLLNPALYGYRSRHGA